MWGGNLGVKSVKLVYFLKDLLLYYGTWFRQTAYKVPIIKEGLGSTKIINFITPGAGVLVLRCGYMTNSENALFFKILLFYSGASSGRLSA